MKLRTFAAYLCIPALLTVGAYVVARRNDAFDLADFSSYVFAAFFFYAAPYLLWAIIAKFAGYSIAVRHAGFIAATVALLAIAALWLLPGDRSGLPMQWLLYWPLALVLQITVITILPVLDRRAILRKKP